MASFRRFGVQIAARSAAIQRAIIAVVRELDYFAGDWLRRLVMTQSKQPPVRRRRKRARHRSALPNWALGALVGFFIFATGLAAYVVFVAVRDLVASVELPGSAGPGASQGTVSVAAAEETAETGGAALPFTAWQGADRVTVLVMGVDERAEVETDTTAFRTDSMMLLTIDPIGETAGMLSIPRDLWVQIPGFEERDRINSANFKGDVFRLPGGGPALAKKTIEANLGVAVDFYVRINFTAFETFVDEIGGIDIDVPQAINDPKYPDCCYGYDPFYIDAGPQHLDGRTALKYARTRATFGGDFDRATRQQQVILAVRDKVLNLDSLPTLLTRAPVLYNALADSYDSDMTLDQMISLGLLASEIDRANIQSAVIDNQYILAPYTTPDGAQVIILDTFLFRELRDEMFYTPGPLLAASSDPAELLAVESAAIEVQNGSTQEGLATATADYLTAQGLNVAVVGNADRFDYTSTVIVDFKGRPYTTRWLAEQFGISSASIFAQSDPNNAVDVRLIVGADFVLPGNDQ